MAITSVELGGIEIHDGTVYATGADTAYALEALSEIEAVLVAMEGRHPIYVADQPKERTIPLVVFMLEPTFAERETAYNALVTAWRGGLKPLVWVNGSTKTLQVHVNSLVPSNWYSRATADVVAPNPDAV